MLPMLMRDDADAPLLPLLLIIDDAADDAPLRFRHARCHAYATQRCCYCRHFRRQLRLMPF